MNGVVDLTDEITYLRDENKWLQDRQHARNRIEAELQQDVADLQATVERLRRSLAESEKARLIVMRCLDRDQSCDPNKEDKKKRRETRVTNLD